MVKFSQSMYHINEHDGPAKFTLVLDTPSSFNITLQVRSIDGSATGKLASIWVGYHNYVMQQVEV